MANRLLRPFRDFTHTSYTKDEAALANPARLGADAAVFLAVALLIFAIYRLTNQIDAPIQDIATPATFDTNPALLPYYAARSLLRMFAALIASTIFTFLYATLAAKSRRAEKILIPLLDILQSVPVLGFLSVTLTMWLALFPGSEIGVELAAIFAIFTSQVWNMTFAFYQAQVTEPKELDEAARAMRLTRWQRFWQLDAPSGVMPLVWNGMMSFGGGWFFLIASEVISVNNAEYALPGIGSYVAAVTENQQLGRLMLAIAVMVLMVVGVNFFFWRPLTAWAERFRLGDSSATTQQRSYVLDLIRHSTIPGHLAKITHPVGEWLNKVTKPLGSGAPALVVDVRRRRVGDVVFTVIVGALIVWGTIAMLLYLHRTVGLGEFVTAVVLGFATFARVMVMLIIATIIFVPIGVWIGLNPKVTRIMQPVVQVLASFPANFLFPFVTMFLLWSHISLNIGGVFLMALGAQWYILFNVMAGAAAIPNDLREVATNLRMPLLQRWKDIYGPAIFASWVTGGITAAGGAWNASIVAEVVNYGGTNLTATGLGAYITQATTEGNFAKTFIGVIVMAVFVVGLNRVLWKPLNKLAERRFSYV